MNPIHRDIFRAIHEGKWLKIEYRNKEDQVTRYWIGIRDLNAAKRTLAVDGLHLSRYTTDSYHHIYIDSIQSSQIVEGSYCPVNRRLVEDISQNPHRYKTLFDNTANLKILSYLEMCNRMDTIPYYSDYELVSYLDGDSLIQVGEAYELSDEQFRFIVKHFQRKMDEKSRTDGRLIMQQLAMNVVSLHTGKGLYVLAYRKLHLDVMQKTLRPDPDISICTEFKIDGSTQESIRRYLDADEYELLQDFARNQETIKDRITGRMGASGKVDDMPYVIGLGMDIVLDLHEEYQAILQMCHEERETIPIQAFFGDLLHRPRRIKNYPITLQNDKVNLDQLLAIHHGMKYPLAYIQGPPGTGKTNTILNTILTAFFNEKTVLFASYNNHPISTVFEKLMAMEYKGKPILFPALRLGNTEKVKEAIRHIKAVYQQAKDIPVYESTLDKKKDDRIQRTKELSGLLKQYEELLDLREREETLDRMLEHQENLRETAQTVLFHNDLQAQREKVRQRIRAAGEITEEDAMKLLETDFDQFYQYLYYTSVRHIKKLDQGKFQELRDILFQQTGDEQVKAFSKYLRNTGNIRELQKVFPVMITTCISAHKLGAPEPFFDMVIMDEASQCNTAVSLVPILRGSQLMLVGDPQQLNPVILLDEMTNRKLRHKYRVADEYDYRENSVYKTFLACDAVSDEVLLRSHYRCHEKIIEFSNRKYYHSRLKICTASEEEKPLVFMDVSGGSTAIKNTAPEEVDAIIDYACRNRGKQIAVITPFVNQRKLIEEAVRERKLQNVTCGTVHAFQGDEKDVVLFSTALTEHTYRGTYEWLKNNKELINVATSRARNQLIVLADSRQLHRLHQAVEGGEDDLYELVEYVRRNGQAEVTRKKSNSRALGVKPFSTATEEAFLMNLTHAMQNILLSQNRYKIQREVAISQVFESGPQHKDLFYSGRFDFVVYERQGGQDLPVLAIELDGKEHMEDAAVRSRDRKKEEICHAHQLQLIRVENSYARRYNYIKEILTGYFSRRQR